MWHLFLNSPRARRDYDFSGFYFASDKDISLRILQSGAHRAIFSFHCDSFFNLKYLSTVVMLSFLLFDSC
jgi:hypothetical protein